METNEIDDGFTSVDEDRAHRLQEKLDITLPHEMTRHLAVLGREPIIPRSFDKNRTKKDFECTHLGDEFVMIDAVKKHKEDICNVLFPDGDPIVIKYKGAEIKIDSKTFDTDIQWLIMASDIGKAGVDGKSREGVAMLFNDILIGPDHDQWLSEHRKDLSQICDTIGVQVGDYKASIFVPIGLATHMTSEIASKKGISESEVQRLSLTKEKIDELSALGIDHKKSAMRDLWNSHLRLGEKFLDTQILDSRVAALSRLALCHHLGQGYGPECFENGELELGEGGTRIAVFLEALDKMDAFRNRSGFDTDDSLGILEKTLGTHKILKNGVNEVDIKNAWETVSKMDWVSISNTLGE